jgi:hypothetical protein
MLVTDRPWPVSDCRRPTDTVEKLLKTWSTRFCWGSSTITRTRSVQQRPFYDVEFFCCACSAPPNEFFNTIDPDQPFVLL